jgi:hypothetical protein
VLVAAGCGDDGGAPDALPADRFELVGHSDLGARGMNAALAVAGDTVYVGSRIDGAGRDAGVLIVDVSDPAAPAVVGAIGPPDESLIGMSSRELRVVPDLDLLVVLNMVCSPDLHGCSEPAAERENLKLYDISDRHAPVLVGTYFFATTPIRPRSPHEMFLWRDPAEPGRVLMHMSVPITAPTYEIVDISDPALPVRAAAWDPASNGGLIDPIGPDNLIHSVSVSNDGRTAYVSHLQGGLFLVDVGQVVDRVDPPVITMATPPAAVADWSPPEPAGPHSAVPVPGRDLLVVTDEVYPMPFGTGCPFGWLRTVDVSDPAAPAVLAEHKLAENGMCGGVGERVTFTAHNSTVTENLALVSWHAAGLQAIDLADPAAPRTLAEFRPEPLEEVAVEDPGIGGHPITMWSYPVVQDGLIYVIDIRNGLYVLRYVGEHAEELDRPGPYEGNSNVGG